MELLENPLRSYLEYCIDIVVNKSSNYIAVEIIWLPFQKVHLQ